MSEIDFVNDSAVGFLAARQALQHLVEFTDPCFPCATATGTGQVFCKVVVAFGHVFQERRPPVRSGASTVSGERWDIIWARTASQKTIAIDNEDCSPEVAAGGLAIITARATAEQLQTVVGVQQFSLELALVLDHRGQGRGGDCRHADEFSLEVLRAPESCVATKPALEVLSQAHRCLPLVRNPSLATVGRNPSCKSDAGWIQATALRRHFHLVRTRTATYDGSGWLTCGR